MNKIKLFCFPYAGGSSVVYKKWMKYIDDNIELVPVELAGRGYRFDEELCDNIGDIVEDMFHRIKHMTTCNYALFGHSMGSIIAHELAHYIASKDMINPEYLIVSGRKPPLSIDMEYISHLSDDEFKREISSKGGTPKEFFQNKELTELFLPILRNDFKVVEEYKYTRKSKLNCKLAALYGSDEKINNSEIMLWKEYTNNSFKAFKIKGDHFFINENAKDTVSVVNSLLCKNYLMKNAN